MVNAAKAARIAEADARAELAAARDVFARADAQVAAAYKALEDAREAWAFAFNSARATYSNDLSYDEAYDKALSECAALMAAWGAAEDVFFECCDVSAAADWEVWTSKEELRWIMERMKGD